MTFDFGETLNKFIDSCLQNETLAWIAGSPVWTAIVIACIMIIIASLVTDSTSGQLMRFGFWSVLLMSGIMILHNRVILQEAESMKIKLGSAEVFAHAPMAEHMSDYVPAIPTLPAQAVTHV